MDKFLPTDGIEISCLAHEGTTSHHKTDLLCSVQKTRKEGHSRWSHYRICLNSDFKEGYPFASTGVDFAGLLFLKTL